MEGHDPPQGGLQWHDLEQRPHQDPGAPTMINAVQTIVLAERKQKGDVGSTR